MDIDLAQVGREVAAALTKLDTQRWFCKFGPNEQAVTLQRGAGGFGIILNTGWAAKGRIAIYGALPQHDSQGRSVSVLAHNEKRAEITVSQDRDPASIAKEAWKRLIPDALKQYDRALEIMRDRNESHERTRENVKRLARFGRSGTQGQESMVYAGDATLQVSDTSVRFTYLSVSPDQAERILEILARDASKLEKAG